MAKPTISGRVPQPLKDEFEEYREERDLSMTDAQRQLLRAGLDARRSEQPTRTLRSGTHVAPSAQSVIIGKALPIVQTVLLVVLTALCVAGGVL